MSLTLPWSSGHPGSLFLFTGHWYFNAQHVRDNSSYCTLRIAPRRVHPPIQQTQFDLHIQGLYGNHQGQVTVGLASILIGGLTKLLETGKEINQPSVHYRTCNWLYCSHTSPPQQPRKSEWPLARIHRHIISNPSILACNLLPAELTKLFQA